MNEYSGCRDIDDIEIISASNIKPIEFFTNYIRTRTPVMFSDYFPELKDINKKWSDNYFNNNCGNCNLKIEYRDSSSETFGKGKEKKMLFRDFLKEVHDGLLYLTTQDLSYNAEDQPTIVTPPLTEISNDFPIQPKLTGKLIPANINLWYGSTRKSTTSGLHHDFHDNMYVLLRGRKLISLYSPAHATSMHTVGDIDYIHRNGRINYQGQPTNADGSDINCQKALEASKSLQEAAAKLTELEENCNEEELSDVEIELEDALDAVLDAEIADQIDDYSDSDEASDEAIGELNTRNKRRFEEGNESKPFKKMIRGDGRSVATDTATATMPSNFSRVDTSKPISEITKLFPKFIGVLKQHHSAGLSEELPAVEASMVVDLKAGQMLYIPAGWFHEVRSINEDADSSIGSEYKGHVALNYWFHPPDNLDASSDGFNKPYKTDFWSTDFDQRRKHNYF